MGSGFAKPSAVVLLSAGLDSTYNFYRAIQEHSVGLALTFDYGQQAAPREIAAAVRLAQVNGVPHQVVALPWFKDFTKTSLITGTGIPQGVAVEMASL